MVIMENGGWKVGRLFYSRIRSFHSRFNSFLLCVHREYRCLAAQFISCSISPGNTISTNFKQPVLEDLFHMLGLGSYENLRTRPCNIDPLLV